MRAQEKPVESLPAVVPTGRAGVRGPDKTSETAKKMIKTGVLSGPLRKVPSKDKRRDKSKAPGVKPAIDAVDKFAAMIQQKAKKIKKVPLTKKAKFLKADINKVGKHRVSKASPVAENLMPTAIPTKKEIEVKTTALTGPVAAAFSQVMTGLQDHLGSPEAARLWLVTPSEQFETTPLDAILGGEAESVLAFLEAHWGAGPVYA